MQTVLGPVPGDELGLTTVHEHLFHDLTVLVPRPDTSSAEGFEDRPLRLENLWWSRQGGWNADNFVMKDLDLAVEEVAAFGSAGGSSMAELTPRTMGRDVAAMATVARATGVNIIAASGYATGGDPASIDAQVEEYVREVEVGIDETGIRAGVLQILPLTRNGISALTELAPTDRAGIEATAAAQMATGVALSVEPPPSTSTDQSRADLGLGILEMILERGVSPDRVAVTTLDGRISDLADRSRALRRIADTGAFIQLGLWGAEQWKPTIPGDGQRLQLLVELIDEGYGSRLLLGHDIASKMRLRSYGGRGYAHIPQTVRVWLGEVDIPEPVIREILVDNPRRLLTPSGV